MSAPVTLNRVVDVLCLVMLLICLYNYIYSVLLNSVRNHSLDGATCWFHVSRDFAHLGFHVKGKRLITGVGVGDLHLIYADNLPTFMSTGIPIKCTLSPVRYVVEQQPIQVVIYIN